MIGILGSNLILCKCYKNKDGINIPSSWKHKIEFKDVQNLKTALDLTIKNIKFE